MATMNKSVSKDVGQDATHNANKDVKQDVKHGAKQSVKQGTKQGSGNRARLSMMLGSSRGRSYIPDSGDGSDSDKSICSDEMSDPILRAELNQSSREVRKAFRNGEHVDVNGFTSYGEDFFFVGN